jgi:5-formyltetrahydrofolate cyclo-ligase
MQKKEIRASFRQQRLKLTLQDVSRYADLLLIMSQQAGLPPISVLMGYLADSNRNEPDPANIIRWLRFTSPGMLEVMPRIQPSGGGMDAVIFEEGQSCTFNQFGIEEPDGEDIVDPEDIDLVLVPLLAFDRKGNRVGYGKGYYDRFLHRCRKDCLKVGLSFFGPVEEISDVHPGDVRLDLCITPERVYQWPTYS